MAYTPNYSYNYNLPNIDLSGLMSQGLSGASNLMGQRYAGEGQLQDARLQNALALQQGQLGESGRQFDVTTGLTREQIRYQQQQDQLAREAAEREMNWARSLNNPAVSGAVQNNVANAFAAMPTPRSDVLQQIYNYNNSRGLGYYNRPPTTAGIAFPDRRTSNPNTPRR